MEYEGIDIYHIDIAHEMFFDKTGKVNTGKLSYDNEDEDDHSNIIDIPTIYCCERSVRIAILSLQKSSN